MRRISLYWRCQLIGWASFVTISYVFNNIIYKDFIGFFYKAIIIFLFGLAFSHLVKLTINATGILNKKFSLQIIYLSILTIVFSLVSTYVWMITLIKIGVWNVNKLTKERPDVSFYQVYFYNLFIILLTLAGWVLIYFLFHYVKTVRREEQLKVQLRFEMIELEAKALRSQMNPHFIFNCMNSIKSLIQKNDQEKSILYLTTFSKLIRTVFQNSDKREISLHDEIETCRLYTQLESMRFNNKFNYQFNIDKTLDLKSVMVPALIVQPFIENAIWHGIMPKEDGGSLIVKVSKTDHTISCIVDDNGIGREISKQNKFTSKDPMHESKGEHLTQARLDLDNLLNERNAKIEIIDQKDENSKPTGTTVILSFKED
jgi:sensor histidine kinase YesM